LLHPTHYDLAGLTPDFLTSVLRRCTGLAGVQIADIRATPVGAGQMADSYRLELDYSTTVEAAPTTVIAKVTSSDATSRQMAVTMSAYLREVRFYQRLAQLVSTRVPGCFHADVTPDRARFILILEDLGPARSIDQLAACSVDEAALALGQLAALHGPVWRHGVLETQHWLPMDAAAQGLVEAIPHLVVPWLERFGERVEAVEIDVVAQLGRNVGDYVPTLGDHRTLQHGDYRLDNLLFDAQSSTVPLVAVDWQSISSAPGIADVSYFLGTSLTESERLGNERDLVGDYHRQLLSYGVDDYLFDQCWREYQAHAVYGLILTIPTSLGVQKTDRGDAMFATMVRRVAAQVTANESFAVLAAL
jgi:aminoglycoside/choline kinase family phosphotransferase